MGFLWVFRQCHYALAANTNAFSVAKQKQIFRAGMFQKMQKLCGASAGCAKMRIRNPDASVILKPGNLFVHKSDLTVAQPAYVLIKIFCGNVSD